VDPVAPASTFPFSVPVSSAPPPAPLPPCSIRGFLRKPPTLGLYRGPGQGWKLHHITDSSSHFNSGWPEIPSFAAVPSSYSTPSISLPSPRLAVMARTRRARGGAAKEPQSEGILAEHGLAAVDIPGDGTASLGRCWSAWHVVLT
jgi:hypothetical protein